MTKEMTARFLEEFVFADGKLERYRGDSLLSIDCAQSESFKPEDKDRIVEVIQRTIGFSGLNSMVLGVMERWIYSSLFLKMKGNKERRELCLDAIMLPSYQERELGIEKIGSEHSGIILSSKILQSQEKQGFSRFFDFKFCRK